MTRKENAAFIKSFLWLAVPMAMQNAVTNLVSLVDNIMVTRLGTVPVASVGLANQIYFVFTVILLGLCGGGAAFITQYSGLGDYKGIKRTVFINMSFSMGLAVIFSLATFIFPEHIMQFLSGDPEVVASGAVYLRWMSVGYLLSGVTLTVSYILKNLEFAKITLYGSLIALVFNVMGDYVLIFGKFGFPEMGVKGAAVATIISRVVEAAFIVVFALRKVSYLRCKPSEYTDGAKKNVPVFLKTAMPVTVNEALWSVGSAMLSVIYARISTDAIAAVNISTIVYNLLFVLQMGMASAAGVIVGKEIGGGNDKAAYEKSKKMSAASMVVSVGLFFITLAACPLMIKIFDPEPHIANTVRNLIIITAAYGPVHSYNLVNICGSLRTGGDVVFCMIADPGTMWLLGVGLASLCVFVFRLPIELTYFIVHLENVAKLFLVYLRKRKSDWIRKVV